jgi:hypothetical protein
VETLTLLAAPIDFGGRESLLNVWTLRKYFDVDAFIDAHGNCPAWFLQLCFLSTKPIQNLLEKQMGFYEQMDDPRFLSNYFAMERWVNDNIPVAGETFRQFVRDLYQDNQLVRGEFHLGPRRIDLARISCPLLLLTAKHDHLVSPASTYGINRCASSVDVKEMTIDAGQSAAKRTRRSGLSPRGGWRIAPAPPNRFKQQDRHTWAFEFAESGRMHPARWSPITISHAASTLHTNGSSSTRAFESGASPAPTRRLVTWAIAQHCAVWRTQGSSARRSI